jgi:integrase
MRRPGKLKALNVERLKAVGMYGDGGGLYLQVTGAGAKSWIFRYWVRERDPATGQPLRDAITNKVRGVSREMGLGSFNVVTLDEARDLADKYRRLRHQGVDPIDGRRAAREQAAFDAARAISFKDAATAYIAAHRAGWRNEKHAAQWGTTLEAYAYPEFGAVSVQSIDTALVMKVLEPIWSTKPETASRVRGRVEAILDWATARGFRKGENPARWRGHLNNLLPAPAKVRMAKHYVALPYTELPTFLVALRQQEGHAARALEWTILTAARTGDTIGATPDEIREREKLWTIPGERMKAGKEHRVPLSARALAIVDAMKPLRGATRFLFPGGKQGKPLSNMAMTEVLRRMGRGDITVHGFRSTFRDWAAERTEFPNEVAEMALAHAVGNKVEAAYRRGELLEKRRGLMEAWAEYCCKAPTTGEVIALRSAVGAGASSL